MSIAFRAVSALCLAASFIATAAEARLQCVPFARELSGIQIRGNAETWWGQAEGRYERSAEPAEGAVLAMPGTRRNPHGHVAVVSRIVGDRELLISHANWSRPGMIERNVRAVDVSPAGDWSQVRIWHAGSAQLGATTYPASGFILPRTPRSDAVDVPLRIAFALPAEVRELASRGG